MQRWVLPLFLGFFSYIPAGLGPWSGGGLYPFHFKEEIIGSSGPRGLGKTEPLNRPKDLGLWD